MLTVRWGDRLEGLADDLFDSAAAQGDPFVPECVVVGSPVIKGWLKQHFLFDRPASRQRVLAGWDFVPLHQFVNDWLARAAGLTGPRQPLLHPYSPECLRWRIYRLLERGDLPHLDLLQAYTGRQGEASARRRFGLAGQLARMFDDYQNHRAAMLFDWEQGRLHGLDAALAWQPALWNALVRENPSSYLHQFLTMDRSLPGAEIAAAYRRVSVFHVPSMPPPALHFFERLSTFLEVTLYAFNPSREEWFDDRTPRLPVRPGEPGALMGGDDPLDCLDAPNPLLGGLGKGCQAFLRELLDRTDGQAEADGGFGEDRAETLLERVQAQIRNRAAPPAVRLPHPAGDPSLEFHACHSPLREVEVLHDRLLDWFADDPSRQPRGVQVLVADLDTYAPFIDAVFKARPPGAPDAIPYELADRPSPGTGPLGRAFLAILRLREERFAASRMLGILETDAVRQAFGLTRAHVDALREHIAASGIRWGADAAHLRDVLGVPMDDTATWRRGLDRLLVGYAMGRDEDTRVPQLVDCGPLGHLLACEAIEGEAAVWVGTLGRFFDALSRTAGELARPCGPDEWSRRLHTLLATFFPSTNETFAEAAEIQQAIQRVCGTAHLAGVAELPLEVVATALETHLATPGPHASASANAVLFTPLRTMRPTPRPLLCLLGMDEGVFPRSDDRPTFDLTARQRRRGDRSPRLEDRLAFLETLMCARERLVISFVGRDKQTNENYPPSTVVAELLQYLHDTFATPESPGTPYPLAIVQHRLQAFHPDYFRNGSPLPRSYSGDNYQAAVALCDRVTGPAPEAPPALAVAGDCAPPLPNPPPSPSPGREAPCAVATAGAGDNAHTPLSLRSLQAFFTNPARTFLEQTLQLTLDDPRDEALPDTETFGPDGLQTYQCNDTVLRRLLSDTPPGELRELLLEQGLIPFGATGSGFVEARAAEIRAFLETPLDLAGGEPVRALLEAARDTPGTPCTARLGEEELVGTVQTLPLRGETLQVFARYTEPKSKDYLRAWLAHLFGHAAGQGPFTTWLIGTRGRAAMAVPFPALDAATATPILRSLAALHRAGQTRVLAFAPACTEAYVRSLRQKRDPAAALQAAREPWTGSHFARGDAADPWLRRAWGDTGPMAAPEFHGCAVQVWSPLLDLLEAHARSAGGTP